MTEYREPRYPISTITAIVKDLDPEFDTATVRKWRQRPGIIPSDEAFEAEGTTSTTTYTETFAVWLRVLLELNRQWGMELATASSFAQIAAAIGMRRARVFDHKGGGAARDKGYEYLVITDPKDPEAATMRRGSDLSVLRFVTSRSIAIIIDAVAATERVRAALREAQPRKAEESKP